MVTKLPNNFRIPIHLPEREGKCPLKMKMLCQIYSPILNRFTTSYLYCFYTKNCNRTSTKWFSMASFREDVAQPCLSLYCSCSTRYILMWWLYRGQRTTEYSIRLFKALLTGKMQTDYYFFLDLKR